MYFSQFVTNVQDSLEGHAGVPSELLIAAHGNFDSAHAVDDLRLENDNAAKRPEVDIGELKDRQTGKRVLTKDSH